MTENIKLTLLVPAYNEVKIIGRTIKSIINFLSGKNFGWEIIVVDDGSQDKTSQVVKSFKKPEVRLVKFAENQGKGAAIRAGILEAKGNFVIFSDADLSVSIERVEDFLQELKKSDVVIGSRRVKGAKILIHQSWLRETLGRGFTLITNLILGMNLSDFTCGFKGFRRKAALEIFGRAQIDRWSYDAEILFLAQKLGYKIVEVPVHWRNRKETRVTLGADILTSFRDLFRIRINDFLGKYGS